MSNKPSAAQKAAQLLDQYAEMDVIRALLREDRERRQMKSLAWRLMLHTKKSAAGCWLWTGHMSEAGYGIIQANGTRRAHRVSYEFFRGPIPAGRQLDHLCRVRNCINPEHLEVVTQQENINRGNGFAVINKNKRHCVHGHEFTPENTIKQTSRGKTYRACRECRRLLQAARRLAKRSGK